MRLVLCPVMHSDSSDSGSLAADHSFSSHPEHADAIHAAILAIQKLALEQPEFAKRLRDMTTTEEVRLELLSHGIDISAEALWRHRGLLLKDGHPTWRG